MSKHSFDLLVREQVLLHRAGGAGRDAGAATLASRRVDLGLPCALSKKDSAIRAEKHAGLAARATLLDVFGSCSTQPASMSPIFSHAFGCGLREAGIFGVALGRRSRKNRVQTATFRLYESGVFDEPGVRKVVVWPRFLYGPAGSPRRAP
jgi:hypothetical protein